MPGHRLARILLVEDNPGDVLLIRRQLEAAGFVNPVEVAHDGEEALARIRGEGRHAGTPLPDLVLLDINLPKVDGHEVLRQVKADPALEHLPVVMLTSSAAEADVLRAYRTHANAYLTKGFDLEQLGTTMQGLGAFWLDLVTLPEPMTAGGAA